MQRVAELELLSATGRALVTSELDASALCELIAQEAGSLLDNQTFQVGLFDHTFYQILYWTIDGRPQETPQTFDLNEDPGVVGWVRDSKQTLLVGDFHRELHSLPAAPRYISQTPPRSAIFIPLISGGNVIGIVAAQSQQPNRFNEEDMRRLMILSNQAAAAIANAQLYEQAQMRVAHLELVSEIARQVNAVQDLEEIFSQVVYLTHEMFGFQPVNIFGLDAQSGYAVLKASSLPQLPAKNICVPSAQGIVGTAVAEQTIILSNNTREDPRFFVQADGGQTSFSFLTRAEIAIPLEVNDEVLGVLDVHSHQVGAFTTTEKTVLQALAAEVASAIYKAQQFAHQQEQAWLTNAQYQIAAALSQNITPEQITETITRLTPMLSGVSVCGILLWDSETAVYHGVSLYDPSQTTQNEFPSQIAIGDWHALDAVHVGREMLTTCHLPPWLKCDPPYNLGPGDSGQEITLIPLFTKSQTLGAMLVGNNSPVPSNNGQNLPSRQIDLLQNIAQQTGQALETAYLRQAQQEEAWVNAVLLQVAEAVNSKIDLNEILSTIVRLVPMLVGMESILILIWDEERQLFRAGPSHGISTMGRGLVETLEVERDELPAVSQLATTALTPNASYYLIKPPPWLVKVLGVESVHAFPLNARGQLVGIMLVGSLPENGRTISGRRLNILNGIAHQAATAVVNNQLYHEAAERERMAQELSVAHNIQASLIPDGRPDIPDCDVASYWQAARQVSGDFYDFIDLRDGNWGIVIADVADKGVPAALFMALSRTILRTVALNRKDPAEVLIRVNQIICQEADSDLFVTLFYAVWQPKTHTLLYANGGHNPPPATAAHW